VLVKLLRLFVSLSLGFIAGAFGSFFTAPAVGLWYKDLPKPSFAPPNWVFGPVWTVLYLLMGISLYLVWKKYLKLFVVHLGVNALWSIVFFGFKDIALALVVIGVLWFVILYMMVKFYRVNKAASLLLLPYFLWVSFAAYLNFSIILLDNFS